MGAAPAARAHAMRALLAVLLVGGLIPGDFLARGLQWIAARTDLTAVFADFFVLHPTLLSLLSVALETSKVPPAAPRVGAPLSRPYKSSASAL